MPDGSNITQSSSTTLPCAKAAPVRRRRQAKAPRAEGGETSPSVECPSHESRRRWKSAEDALNKVDGDDDLLEAKYHEAQNRYVECRVTTLDGVLGKLLMIAEVENLDGYLERMPNLLWPRTLKALIRDLQGQTGAEPRPTTAQSAAAPSFGQLLGDAEDEMNSMQLDAIKLKNLGGLLDTLSEEGYSEASAAGDHWQKRWWEQASYIGDAVEDLGKVMQARGERIESALRRMR